MWLSWPKLLHSRSPYLVPWPAAAQLQHQLLITKNSTLNTKRWEIISEQVRYFLLLIFSLSSFLQ
ncbi:MAG TPA: hypothetical protein PKM59_08925, partial [Thermodesulfobacteriota bacterium]|nr:hypothetical protein [Thermodesulfobacteriota bacterium]